MFSVGTSPAAGEAPAGTDPRPQGLLSLPALADPHVHLDKALTVDLVANPTGDLAGAVDAWLSFRGEQTREQIRERARRGALAFLLNGATALRVQVDTGVDIGLRSVEALVELRSELDGVLDMQIVACASLPLSGRAGVEAQAVAQEALAIGADLLGGAPYLDDDPALAYDGLVQIALDHGVGLDLHVDETLAPDLFTLPLLIDRVNGGFPHPVVVDHLVSLAVQPQPTQRRVAEQLAAARIGVVVLPATNLYLQGRGPATPSARGITAIRALLDAGVTVAAGADNVRDPFNPTGRFDPLETASLLVTAGHLAPEDALRAVSSSARALMGLRDSPRVAGAQQDVVRVRGDSLTDVIAAAPAERTVIRSGRVVARTAVRTWVAGGGER